MDVSFKFPFTMCISGPTRSGKTHFTKKLIENADVMISPPPDEIIWCYGEWQSSYDDISKIAKVKMHEGMPDLEYLSANRHKRKLCVMDDLMMEASTSKGNNTLHSLFSRGSHHWNLSIIHIVQNLFYSNIRTARINSHYLVLLKNPSDALQAINLSKQIYPSNRKFFMEAFKDATSTPFGYLLIDLEPSTDESLRLRTRIFPDEIYSVCFMPKNQ